MLKCGHRVWTEIWIGFLDLSINSYLFESRHLVSLNQLLIAMPNWPRAFFLVQLGYVYAMQYWRQYWCWQQHGDNTSAGSSTALIMAAFFFVAATRHCVYKRITEALLTLQPMHRWTDNGWTDLTEIRGSKWKKRIIMVIGKIHKASYI